MIRIPSTLAVVCLVLATACAGSTQGIPSLHQRTEPWHGALAAFHWSERVDPDTAASSPALLVTLAIPVGRPGAYAFDAPCLRPAAAKGGCESRGVPPGETDAAFWNGTPRVRFNADSTRVGHVTLRFPGRELMHMPVDGAWTFAIHLERLEQDTVAITLLEGKEPVRLEVVTRPHRAAEFRPG
jgi:hypothetical protein